MTTKMCRKCKQTKSIDEFWPGPRYKDGYRGQCKQCEKEQPSRTPEAKMNQIAAIRQRNREFIWDYYSTHPCVDCGESDPLVLELDHCRGTKISNVSQLVHNTRSIASIKAEIEKCDVVCANCHKRRTAKQQSWYIDLL